MRKFYNVTDCQTGSSELVLANGHVDALSFYRKKNNVEKSITLSCADVFVYNNDEGLFITKLSELTDGTAFRKILWAHNRIIDTPMYVVCRMANGMVQCGYINNDKPDVFLKGSTKVTLEVFNAQNTRR